MDPRHEPDRGEPTNQGGRQLMVTLVPVAILLVLAILVAVFFLAR